MKEQAETKKLMDSKKEQNKISLFCYSTICLILEAAYALELVKGNRTVGYYLIFSVFTLLPLIICYISYGKNKGSSQIKYLFSIGYSILYTFVMFTGNTLLTFTYIILLMIMMVTFFDFRLSTIINVWAVLVNILSVIYKALTIGLSNEDVVNAEIQIAVIILTAVFAILSARLIVRINKSKLEEIDCEKQNMELILSKNIDISGNLSERIVVVSEQMDMLRKNVDQSCTAMQEVSNGAAQTADAIQMQLTKTESIQEHIDSIKSVSAEIVNNVGDARSSISSGKDNMDGLILSTNESELASKDVNEQLKELENSTSQMQDIVELITGIADQTTLLALNANIEAARAGEMGRGFGVVADEISKLAGQTGEATEEIGRLIQGINQSLTEVIDAVFRFIESSQKQGQYAKQTAENFEEIEQNAAMIADNSGKLEDIVEGLAQNNRSIIENIQNISAITQQVSAHAEETYNTSEEESRSVEHVFEIVEMLEKQASQLTQ